MTYDKRFKKRLLGFLVFTVFAEYRNYEEYKHFISLYFLWEHWRFRFFTLTYRTGTIGAGYYTYFGKTINDAMTVTPWE